VNSPELERWMTKREIADFFGCSVRSIERGMSEGMPFSYIFGSAKFRPSEVEAWLESTGRLERRGVQADPGESEPTVP